MRAAPISPSCSKRARLPSSRPRFGPKRSTSSRSGAAPTAASVVRPSSARRAAVLGPMPGTRPGGEEAKRAHACSRLSTTKPAGFSASEATFATSLLGPMPTEHVSSRGGPDLGDEPAHRRARREQPLDVEVGLVEPDDLHALDVRAHEIHDLPGGLAVGGEVRRQEDRVRAQPPRARGGHRRADAEAARLVAGGGDDRARPAARDDHRPAAQLGMAAQLDRDVERVGVQVRDTQAGVRGRHHRNLAPGSAADKSIRCLRETTSAI